MPSKKRFTFNILVEATIDESFFYQHFKSQDYLHPEFIEVNFNIVFKHSIKPIDCKDIDFLVIRSGTHIDKQFLNEMRPTKLKLIISCITGTNHLDIDAIKKNNFRLVTAAGVNANAVAEFVLQQLLEFLPQKILQSNNVDEKLCLGVIGVGNIGKIITRKARLLGFEVLQNDPPRLMENSQLDFTNTSLSRLLEKSNIISIHTPLTSKEANFSTYHLLNKDNLGVIKSDALVINTARGGVIDEVAWARQPHHKIIDCWVGEPNINLKLVAQARLATPHIAGHSYDAKANSIRFIVTSITDFIYHGLSGIGKNNQCQSVKQFSLQQKIKLNDKVDCLEDLLNLMVYVKNYKEDNMKLHKIIKANDFAKEYQQLRKNYPVHYEYANYQLDAKNISNNMVKLLHGLGFTIK